MALRAFVFLFVLLAGAAPAAADPAWSTYSNDDFGVSTSLPSPPKVSQETTPASATSPRMDTTVLFSQPDKASGYALRLTRAEREPENADAKMDLIGQALSEKMSMPVISQQRTALPNGLMLDLLMGPNPQNLYVRARIILHGADLIQLLSLRVGAAPPSDAFFTDFKFIK